jgi:radical SAM-linked protein
MSEVKQRWRLIFARGDEGRYLSHLDTVHSWERAFRRGGIPVATSEGFNPRPKVVFAAPLQLGMLAEHELADVYLAEKLTAPDLRRRLAAGLPLGYSVVDLHDVWIGAPALAPQLAAADYRLTLLNVEHELLGGAVTRLLAADQLMRERRKETNVIRYDLRPLVFDVQLRAADPAAVPPDSDASQAAGLWMRLRHSQNGGSGRAEEVVAALAADLGLAADVPLGDADETGAPDPAYPADRAEDRPPAPRSAVASPRPALEIVRPVRERLWLAEEL